MGEENQWSLWIINHISNHYFELFNWTTSENKLSNGYAAAPVPAETAAFGMASCLYSCHYTYFMQHQHQHPPHHPILTIFITKKWSIKGVNFQIFFTIKNFRILQWMLLSLVLVASTFIWLSESLNCKQSVPVTKPAHIHAPHLYRSQNGSLYLQHDDDALA